MAPADEGAEDRLHARERRHHHEAEHDDEPDAYAELGHVMVLEQALEGLRVPPDERPRPADERARHDEEQADLDHLAQHVEPRALVRDDLEPGDGQDADELADRGGQHDVTPDRRRAEARLLEHREGHADADRADHQDLDAAEPGQTPRQEGAREDAEHQQHRHDESGAAGGADGVEVDLHARHEHQHQEAELGDEGHRGGVLQHTQPHRAEADAGQHEHHRGGEPHPKGQHRPEHADPEQEQQRQELAVAVHAPSIVLTRIEHAEVSAMRSAMSGEVKLSRVVRLRPMT